MKFPEIDFSDQLFYTVSVVSTGHFFSHFYLLTLPPLFPLIIIDFDVNNTELGLLMSAIYLSQLLLQIPAGELVDRIGAKYVFVIGVFLSGFGTMLIGFADSYIFLLAFAFVSGTGQAAFHPADYALIDAVTTDTSEGKGFGIHSFAGFVGFAAAPPIVGAIGILYSWETALIAVGSVGVAYAAFSYFTLSPVYLEQFDPTERETTDNKLFGSVSLLKHPAILAMFGFLFVMTMGSIGINTFTTVFLVTAYGFTEAVGNAALTMYLTGSAIAILVGGVLADRYNFYWIIILSLIASAIAIGLGVTPLAGIHPASAIILWTIAGIFLGLSLPARDRVINALSSAGDTGKSFGIVYTGLPLGGFIGPALVGAVFDTVNVFAGFALSAMFFLASAGVILVLYFDVFSIWVANQPGESG